jgi:hypothetical protein
MNTPTAHYHPTSVTVENHSHPITGRAGFIVLDRSQFAEGVIYNSFWTTNYNEATGQRNKRQGVIKATLTRRANKTP